MTRPNRPCLGLPGHPCGQLTRNPNGRCRPCQQAHDRTRNRARTQYAGTWRATSKRARAAEPWCHCQRPNCHGPGPCLNPDLTLDHEHAQVECRSCNSSHRRDAQG